MMRRILLAGLLVLFGLFIVLPLAMVAIEGLGNRWFGSALLPASWTLRWFRYAAETANLEAVLLNTAYIALLATFFTLVVALPAAWALARRHVAFKAGLVALVLLPRMIPEITFALGVARIFYNFDLTNTYAGIALAHVILAAPFAVLVLIATFEGMDQRLLEAGRVCGCGPLALARRVILPLAMPGIIAAALFSFLASYNDFVLTLLVYGPDTVTLPVQTYLSIGNGYMSVAGAISVILLAPSLLFLLLLLRMVRPETLLGGMKGA